MNDKDLNIYGTILQACDDVLEKCRLCKMDQNRWRHDWIARDSIILSLGQIGEAVGRFKTKYHQTDFPDIPWGEIKGMRNVLYHTYWQIDLDVAWRTVSIDVPQLKEKLLENPEVAEYYGHLSTSMLGGDELDVVFQALSPDGREKDYELGL